MDVDGGTNFMETGTSQLYAVPYALYAENAGNLIGSEPKQSTLTQKSTQNKTNSSGGNRSGTPNTKFPASGNSYTNVDNGNLGVGTVEPSEKLEVIGNIKASGSISSNGPLIMYDDSGNPRELTINPDGTWDMKFLCEGFIRDIRDNKSYSIVKIGSQCWMAENLNIGDRTNGINNQTDNGDIEKYCYNDFDTKCDTFGGLYQWNEMMQYTGGLENRGVCPMSWHIPSIYEWELLVDYLGGTGVAGGEMKEVGTDHWNEPNTGATNLSGFTAYGAGERWENTGGFIKLGIIGTFWSATDDGGTYAQRIRLFNLDATIQLLLVEQNWGFSIRCIKDFECGDSIIDHRDNKKYGTVLIGKQCWMSHNLNIGTWINGGNIQQNNSTIEKYCYGNNEDNCDTLGGLYQWNEAMQYDLTEGVQGVCPIGWHIPTTFEWRMLESTADSYSDMGDYVWDAIDERGYDAGYHLKSTAGWNSNGNGDNYFGFSAVPGGYWSNSGGNFLSLHNYANFWSSTDFSTSSSWVRRLYHGFDMVIMNYENYASGLSVRCVKDD